MENPSSGVRSAKTVRISKKQKRVAIAAVLLSIVIALVILVNNNFLQSSQAASTSNSANKVQVANAIATQHLNRKFNFDIEDKTGKVATSFTYNILSAELRDEIIINGQKYHPIADKTFLIINLEITNNFTQTINIQPRDYLRIILDKSSEKLAPDIFNDPVEVQAISTKPTRLALAIDTKVKQITMQVGEISGSKVTIPLTIKYE